MTNVEIWRTSSYSGSQGECVEVAYRQPGSALVRDSKSPDTGTVHIPSMPALLRMATTVETH